MAQVNCKLNTIYSQVFYVVQLFLDPPASEGAHFSAALCFTFLSKRKSWSGAPSYKAARRGLQTLCDHAQIPTN